MSTLTLPFRVAQMQPWLGPRSFRLARPLTRLPYNPDKSSTLPGRTVEGMSDAILEDTTKGLGSVQRVEHAITFSPYTCLYLWFKRMKPRKYIHTYIHAYMHACTYIDTYIYIHIYMCISIYIYICVCICMHTFVCAYVCMYVCCLLACLFVCTHV